MKRLSFGFVMIMMLLITSCRSSFEPVATIDVAKDSHLSCEDRYNAVVSSYGEWNMVSMPFQLRLELPEEKSISGRATMFRDENVQLSFRAMGMEVVYLYLSEDSVIAIDKINKLYIAEPLSEIVGATGITIGNIQDLLLGQAFKIGGERLTSSMRPQFELYADSANWSLMPMRNNASMRYDLKFYNADVLESLNILIADNEFGFEYSIPTKVDAAGVVSQKCLITGYVGEQQIKSAFVWNAKDAKWSDLSPLKRRKLPRSYTRIGVDELVYIISSVTEEDIKE